MKAKKNQKTQEHKKIVVPRLVKAAVVAAREAEAAQPPVAEKAARPVIRTPRNAVEARDIFNALFGEAA